MISFAKDRPFLQFVDHTMSTNDSLHSPTAAPEKLMEAALVEKSKPPGLTMFKPPSLRDNTEEELERTLKMLSDEPEVIMKQPLVRSCQRVNSSQQISQQLIFTRSAGHIPDDFRSFKPENSEDGKGSSIPEIAPTPPGLNVYDITYIPDLGKEPILRLCDSDCFHRSKRDKRDRNFRT